MSLMTIGQLARRTGVRSSAIRYYEAHGILPCPARTSSDYRLYQPEAIALLRLLVQAKELGFSLQEIRQLIEAAKKQPPCALTRKLAKRHLEEVENEIHRLCFLRYRLKQILCEQPSDRPLPGVCPLIETSQGTKANG